MTHYRRSAHRKFREYKFSVARASRPAAVIRTILTLIILPPTRNFSKNRITRPRLTIALLRRR
jgi:hypothetical protein